MSLTIGVGGFSIHTTHTVVVGLARTATSLRTADKMAIAVSSLLADHFYIPEHDLEVLHNGKTIMVSCSCESTVDALHYARVIEASAKANGYDLFNHLDKRMAEF